MKFILAKKLKMGQIFGDKGKIIPVTLLETEPCFVTQIKEKNSNNGYDAIQIGMEGLKPRKISKSNKTKPYRFLNEFRKDFDSKQYQVGAKIEAGIFSEGDQVKVTAISKGKGFAGVVKRWHFKDKAKAHGHKDMRRPGSIGGRYPQRVIKGKKMAGRMGTEKTTVKNLKIAKVDAEKGLLAIRGSVPGRKGSLVRVESL